MKLNTYIKSKEFFKGVFAFLFIVLVSERIIPASKIRPFRKK